MKPVTLIFISIYFIVHLLPGLESKLFLYQISDANFKYYQFVTYSFTHVNWVHLIINTITIFYFGNIIEKELGIKLYVFVIIATSVCGGLLHQLVSTQSLGGASGVLCAILGCYSQVFKTKKLLLYAVPMQAKYLPAVIIFSSIIFSFTSSAVAHHVHIAGVLVGIVLVRVSKLLHNPQTVKNFFCLRSK